MSKAYLVTEYGDKFKIAFESIKDIGSEGIIFFRPDVVEIVGKDHAGIVDIRLILPASKIRNTTKGVYYYESSSPEIKVGIYTKAIAATLKRICPGDILTLGIDMSMPKELYIACTGDHKKFRANIISLVITEQNDVPPNILDSIKSEKSILIDSSTFHNIIGDLTISDPPVISFECYKRGIRLTGEGFFSTNSDEMGTIETTENPPPKTSFATDHLICISKAKNISGMMKIGISSRQLGVFEYNTTIGTLTFIVSPRVSDDIDDPKKIPPASDSANRDLKRQRFTLDYGSEGTVDI
jgi:hypothetical protein